MFIPFKNAESYARRLKTTKQKVFLDLLKVFKNSCHF